MNNTTTDPAPNGVSNTPQTDQTVPVTGQFDVFEWHQAYASCQKYFTEHAQLDGTVQSVCALVNIYLPFQRPNNPPSSLMSSPPESVPSPFSRAPTILTATQPWVSLVPYIRRLVVTGFDKEPVLRGFFGDDWVKGISPLQECERRNYLFAAKSGGWAKVKAQYDILPHETVPFLMPPRDVSVREIESAERMWSQWLAMEDWMVGPRAPENLEDYHRPGPRASQNSSN